MKEINQYIFYLSIFLIFGCTSNFKKDSIESKNQKRFKLLSSKHTGVLFNNKLSLDEQSEYFNYQYAINGGGLSAGDLNNDGLVDLFFISNSRSNKLYINKGNLQFEDVTMSSGLTQDKELWSVGSTMADINNDGFLDIYVCMAGGKKVKSRSNLLYINNGDMTFTESAEKFGVNDSGHSTQAVFFDYDLDYDLDLMVINHSGNWNERRPFKEFDKRGIYSDKIYINEGGKFRDVSEKVGLENDRYGFGLGVSIGDLNDDMFPDIYIANDYFGSDYLYFNNQDGTFTEKIKKSTKHISLFSMGTDIADYNNDGLLDIVTVDMVAEDNYRQKTNMAGMNPKIFYEAVDAGLHYQYMYNTLQKNNGNGTFSDVAQIAGMPNTDWSWAPLFADFDSDGWKDLFITNGFARDLRDKDANIKLLKEGKIVKENGNTLYKISNLDHYLSFPEKKIPNYAYRNKGDMTFEKVSYDWGLSQLGFSNGAVYSDLDNDGDQDIIINNLNDIAWIYENTSNQLDKFNFLQINVIGPESNIFSLGARVTVKTKDNNTQTQEITLTRGYQSSVDPILTFGLGSNESVEELIVQWPYGKKIILNNIKSNQRIDCNIKDAEDFILNTPSEFIFNDVTSDLQVNYKHIENDFNDFEKEVLLPHKNSQHGPGIAVGDINNDGLDDFYVGGAKNQQGSFFIQKNNGEFYEKKLNLFKNDRYCEDMGALLFDSDNDGDLDLYVVSGGNEFEKDSPLLQDRLYFNVGNGNFTKSTKSLPIMLFSGKEVSSADFDNDGDLDLFVGGRIIPGMYPFSPRSYLLLNNGSGLFTDATMKYAPDLYEPGLVTDSEWVDFNSDGNLDLIVVGEWMSILMLENQKGELINVSEKYNLDKHKGWWNSIASGDFDKDGDKDFILGNNGLNYKYKASINQPFHVYAHDFDNSGTIDIVLGYFNQGTLYPVRGRQCSSEQCPIIKEQFSSYSSFGSADLREVYGDKLDDALHYQVTNFATSYLENKSDSGFVISNLPQEAQLSSVNGIIVEDFDNDGNLDLIMSGNLHVSEVETPRNDASVGLVFKGDGSGSFTFLNTKKSGYYTPGDVKDLKILKNHIKKYILVANNDDKIQLYQF